MTELSVRVHDKILIYLFIDVKQKQIVMLSTPLQTMVIYSFKLCLELFLGQLIFVEKFG